MLRYSISTVFLAAFLCSSSLQVAWANKLSFAQWKQKISIDFYKRGIDKALLSNTLNSITLDPQVITLDRKQPEFTVSFGGYLARRLTLKRIQKAQQALQKNISILREVEHKYGVPKEILVAFWSLETNLGGYMGNKNIIRSLATLAYDGRREKLFTNQLYNAFKILMENPHVEVSSFAGSWAGAMGQPQFMPSTFINYAVDGNDDGKIDLWGDLYDVFHSMGNFLSKLSWNKNVQWGQEVLILLPQKVVWQKTGLGWTLPVAEWVKQGFEPVDGRVPSNRFQQKASIILPLGHTGPAFMVYDNFRVIMRWNNSVLYALSVGLLADLIAEKYFISNIPLANWQKGHLSKQQIIKLQQALELANYSVGGVDGLIGKKTRQAIIRYQLAHQLIPDGYPNRELLAKFKIK